VDQRLLWIDPRVEQRFVTSNDPTDLLKKFRERHARDNVLIFLFDAVNVSHVGCYGSSTGTTPYMDAVASEGIVWEQAFTPAVYTIASTGSLFTGLHPMEHGVLVHTDSLPDPFTTLAEMFRAGGYETGLFSGTGYASPVFGYGQGFNKVWIPKAPVIDAKEFVPVLSDWITKSKEDPFFGYIHFREPHYPFQPPKEFLKRFNASLDFRLPITDNSINRSDEEKRNMIAAYNANLAYVDQQFGRILEVLRSQGLYDRTILVLISDHGEAFWEHGMQGHNASVYEEMIRIPMIMRIPRESAIQGTRRTQIVENTALFPTFLDLFSFSAKQIRPLRKSLLPLLLNKDAEPPEPVLFSQTAGRGSFGIRTPRFKFIERRPERLQDELYDLSTDPGERNNLLQKHPILGAYFKTVFQKRYKEWEKSLALIQTLKKKAVIDQETEEQLRALGYIN
jgi:arylsulfatase A-like enzyme